jgi:hypothetical protein
MKILITEQQINQLVQAERVSFMLSESLSESKNFNALEKKIKTLLLSGVALASIIIGINHMAISKAEKLELIEKARIEQEQITAQAKQDSIFNAKVNACAEYMEKALQNQGFNRNSTKLNPESLVRKAEEHGFDLPLLIATAHYESCFGATPRARKTNSVFSVGAYDSGKNMVKYAHPDDSIEGYINLLYNDYLTDDRTINDLLRPGGFINKNGHRYASKKNYETVLKSIRNKIITQYPELA